MIQQKLAVLLGDAELAALLIAGGYPLPSQIKAATNLQLLAVPGIGMAKLAQIRAVFPRVQ